MTKGLFWGLTTIDIINIVDEHPGPNRKVRARHQFVNAGGPAANSSIAFGAMGNESVLVSGIGRHPITVPAVSDLQQSAVSVHDHAAVPEALPVISSIIVDSSTGDRSVVYSNTQNRTLAPDDTYDQYAKHCSVVLFDGFYLAQAVPLAASLADDVIVVLDGGSWKEGLEELLPFVDYAICSADFRAPGCASQGDLFDYLLAQKITGCAVSHGAEPIVYRTVDNQGNIEISAVEAIDTLGAGDILHGAFCHFITTHSFTKSLQMAADIASFSCRYYGTREWIDHL